jgi:uncharacterized protein YkwD
MKLLLSCLVLISLLLIPQTSVEAIKTRQYCMSAEEQELLGLINAYRIENGKQPMLPMQSLGAAAEHHSRAMAKDDWFSHDFPDGTTWSENMTAHGYTFNAWRGENLAAGYDSVAMAFRAWIESEGHRQNMLGDDFNAAGIGYYEYEDSTYRHYWTLDMASIYDPGIKVCGR